MARITVEDCLEEENNRFALVQLAAKRTKQLLTGAKPLVDGRKGNKSVVNALREIAAGAVRFKTEEDLERERLAEEAIRREKIEQAQAAASLNGEGNDGNGNNGGGDSGSSGGFGGGFGSGGSDSSGHHDALSQEASASEEDSEGESVPSPF
ncbi:MAG: DNA-directed RNA polymerase subunit omega [Bdellovibrionales bacterium]|nr:DNA-directed RNA polymerase subunit omega [Bdellovibrionales bacterium]